MENLSWIHLSIMILASFRLTRLIVYDEITSFLRDPFLSVTMELDGDGGWVRKVEIKGTGLRGWIGKLLSCHWCVGIWSTLIIVTIFYQLPTCFPIILILAIAGAAAVVQTYAE
ncbi:Protein of unknown function [Marininema mesophilum]|uniref:Sporulation protein YjcA n=1 Tax=Marininema mesophilum TaxID=1048340 RepID=A0A1H2ZNV9_9BACL|nr:DUF1360 domain-containing protein [Marininema mesophilum]SDX18389.1 Protein of unknown function [Marininema mesophilum]